MKEMRGKKGREGGISEEPRLDRVLGNNSGHLRQIVKYSEIQMKMNVCFQQRGLNMGIPRLGGKKGFRLCWFCTGRDGEV